MTKVLAVKNLGEYFKSISSQLLLQQSGLFVFLFYSGWVAVDGTRHRNRSSTVQHLVMHETCWEDLQHGRHDVIKTLDPC